MNLATCATHQHGDRNGVLDRVRVHGPRNIPADMEGVKANLTPGQSHARIGSVAGTQG